MKTENEPQVTISLSEYDRLRNVERTLMDTERTIITDWKYGKVEHQQVFTTSEVVQKLARINEELRNDWLDAKRDTERIQEDFHKKILAKLDRLENKKGWRLFKS